MLPLFSPLNRLMVVTIAAFTRIQRDYPPGKRSEKVLENNHYLIKVPSNYVNIRSQSFEVVIALLSAKVSSAEDVLDLSWNQQLFEFGWEAAASMWDVKIS